MKVINDARDAIVTSLAKKILAKYEPGVIAVTGENGRELAQAGIALVMRGFRDVRTTSPYFPTHLAPIIAILGDARRGRGFWFWIQLIGNGIGIWLARRPYPELLIIECPSERHNEAGKILAIVKPQITLVVASSDARAYKASALVEALPSNGYGIVNGDSAGSLALERYTRAHVTTFGFGERCAMRITDYATRPEGISFMLTYADRQALVTMDGVRGKDYAYAAAAGACVGVAFGMNLPRIADALRAFTTKS